MKICSLCDYVIQFPMTWGYARYCAFCNKLDCFSVELCIDCELTFSPDTHLNICELCNTKEE